MAEQLKWSDEQLAQMLWARNPHTGRPTKLRQTEELEKDYLEWLNDECQHFDVAIVRLNLRNGSEQYREQCLECGPSFGTPIKKADVPNREAVPVRTTEERLAYDRRRREDLEAFKQNHVDIQFRAGPGSSEYQEYLRSDEWRAKRGAVMRRAQGTCEGCGLVPATEVHHFTYDNIYEEFLWDLAALCRSCHARQHPDQVTGDD